MTNYTLLLFFICCALATDYSAIIEYVNKANTTWKAGPVDNPERLRHFLGSVESDTKLETIKKRSFFAAIPESFDARTAWPECTSIREIRDQSYCGSCWAVSTAEVATDRLCIGSKGEKKERLSSLDLLSCCTGCGNGCNGGDVYTAWVFVSTIGITTGGEYGSTNWCNSYPFEKCDFLDSSPYPECPDIEAATPECTTTCQSGYPVSFIEDKHFFDKPYTFRDAESMQLDILTNGPLVATFTVYEDFYAYKSGVYQHVYGEDTGAHAIKILGWGVENGVPYWLCANSWNEYWGDHGYFKILRGSNECGIESRRVVAATLATESFVITLFSSLGAFFAAVCCCLCRCFCGCPSSRHNLF